VDDYDSNNIRTLQTLISNLENIFQKKSGGDCPEYSYDGILEALKVEDFGLPVMMEGSQLMVITDAPSKGSHSVNDIISRATAAQVCIHFFLGESTYNCFEDDPTSIEKYETIANNTGGIVVNSKFDFSHFVNQYRSTPCGFLQPLPARSKRNVDEDCHNLNVASLVCSFSISVKTEEDVVILTKPDSKQVRIRPNWFLDTTERIALYSESHPMPGEWTVCARTPIQVSADFQTCIDIAPFYTTREREQPAFTAATPPGCKWVNCSQLK
jgi:hypothetical protein